MPPSDINSLYDLAILLLETATDALVETDEGPPADRYLSPAAPAFDCCPALIVHVASLQEEITSPTGPPPVTGMRTRYGSIILAQLVINVLRCSTSPNPNGSVPLESVTADAHMVQQDGWALWNGITCAIRDGTFKGLCEIVHFDRATTIPEQGGCVGWQMWLRAEIGGVPCEEFA